MTLLIVVAVALLGFWLLGRGFLSATPRQLVGLLPWAGVIAAAGLFVFLAVTGRLYAVLGLLPLLLPMAMRWYQQYQRWRTARGPSKGGQSQVETAFLSMVLHHDSGQLEGEVRQGRFAGRRLQSMSLTELLALLEECRATDPQAVQLLETWLDRTAEGWRAGTTGAGPPATSGAMTEREAWEVLGLAPGAGEADIKEAHRRLMVRNHPDQGGSTYLAAKINQAKDLLLGNKARRA